MNFESGSELSHFKIIFEILGNCPYSSFIFYIIGPTGLSSPVYTVIWLTVFKTNIRICCIAPRSFWVFVWISTFIMWFILKKTSDIFKRHFWKNTFLILEKFGNLWGIFCFVRIVFIPILTFSTRDCPWNVSKIVQKATFSRLRKFE